MVASTFNRVAIDLAHDAFLELAAAVRARSARILTRWRELTLKAMPHLDRLSLEELEDTIARIFSAAADAIRSADPRQLRGLIDEAPSHGIDRFVQKHSLLDLFGEVRILQGVVVVEVATEMRLDVGEAATFHAIFDLIIQQGVTTMVRKQAEQDARTQETTREMNDQLLSASARQHELIELARNTEEALPGGDAMHAMKELAAERPSTRTIIYSAHDDPAFFGRARNAGAWGCVSKNAEPTELMHAVRDGAAGRSAWPDRLAGDTWFI